MIYLLDAAVQYYGNKQDSAVFVCLDDDTIKLTDEFQNKTNIPADELAEIETIANTLQAEYDANAYARTRATAYPSLADQADMQFHDAVDGTTTWQDAIQAVKDANPKPV